MRAGHLQELGSRKQPCDPHIEGSLLRRAFSRKLATHVCK